MRNAAIASCTVPCDSTRIPLLTYTYTLTRLMLTVYCLHSQAEVLTDSEFEAAIHKVPSRSTAAGKANSAM